uniref:Uncharacterized protein n=1 Tax=Arion vulgaris TaxID=1028688 RepID=A0A0B7ALQ2_9EUPU
MFVVCVCLLIDLLLVAYLKSLPRFDRNSDNCGIMKILAYPFTERYHQPQQTRR